MRKMAGYTFSVTLGISTAVLVIGGSLPAAAAEQEVCRLTDDGNVFVKGDNHKIYLFFGAHQQIEDRPGNADINNLMDKSKGSSTAVKNYVMERVSYPGRRDFEAQTEEVKKLALYGKIDWVKQEFLPMTISNSTVRQFSVWTLESRARLRRLLIPQELIDKYFVYAWIGPFNDLIRGEKWTRHITFNGYEDGNLRRAQLVAWKDMLTHLKNVFFEAPKIQVVYDDVMYAQRKRQDLATELENAKNEKYLSAESRRFLGLLSLFFDMRNKRDLIIAQHLLSVKGNGAIIIGAAHREGIKANLEHLCASGKSEAITGR